MVNTLSQPCRLLELAGKNDERGSLQIATYADALPFLPHRLFLISDVPEASIRGQHGNHRQHELLICTQGRVLVELRASGRVRQVMLDRRSCALHLPPGVWSSQQYFDNAQLMVAASHSFDLADRFTDPELASGDVGIE